MIIFFSIGGIPPLTGFLAKIIILFEIINTANIIAAATLIIISSISVYYYIRMINIMFFEPKSIEKNYEKDEYKNLRVKLKSGTKEKARPLDLLVTPDIETEENYLVQNFDANFFFLKEFELKKSHFAFFSCFL